MERSTPNSIHRAIGELGRKGYISSIITQNVDSFHSIAHPHIPVTELHGHLRSVVCVSCRQTLPRDQYQRSLARLNPAWAEFLERLLETGALNTDDPGEQRQKGLRVNPDGDVDLPNAHYSGFRYPTCPKCLESPPVLADGARGRVEADQDGAWIETSNAGILKPAVVMFGESVNATVKQTAEEAVDEAGKLLVMGSSLATFSAWRLVDRAQSRGMAIGILNVGGIRNEASLFQGEYETLSTIIRVRCSERAELVIPEVAARLGLAPR
jgi:NAD-dependent SIR2 family protein deacetylase